MPRVIHAAFDVAVWRGQANAGQLIEHNGQLLPPTARLMGLGGPAAGPTCDHADFSIIHARRTSLEIALSLEFLRSPLPQLK
jgi:hypothetical protein